MLNILRHHGVGTIFRVLGRAELARLLDSPARRSICRGGVGGLQPLHLIPGSRGAASTSRAFARAVCGRSKRVFSVYGLVATRSSPAADCSSLYVLLDPRPSEVVYRYVGQQHLGRDREGVEAELIIAFESARRPPSYEKAVDVILILGPSSRRRARAQSQPGRDSIVFIRSDRRNARRGRTSNRSGSYPGVEAAEDS